MKHYLAFLPSVLLPLSCTIPSSGQNLTAAGVTVLSVTPVGRSLTGVWNGGRLLIIGNDFSAAPVLYAVDKGGSVSDEVALNMPGVHQVNIYGGCFSRARDGFIAVSGSMYQDNGRGSVFLALLPADGVQPTVIRTNPYVPKAVFAAPDGAIWTAGRELVGSEEVDPNHLMIRRFDRKGRLLGQALPRSSIYSAKHPAIGSRFAASRDRIGWYSEAGHIYIEFTPAGVETRRAHIDVGETYGMALCEDNTLWLSSVTRNQQGAPESWSLLSFDKMLNPNVVRKAGPTFVYLYGCEGNVLAMSGGKPDVIEWMATP